MALACSVGQCCVTPATTVVLFASLWPCVSLETGQGLCKQRGFPVILTRVLAFIIRDFKHWEVKRELGPIRTTWDSVLVTSRLWIGTRNQNKQSYSIQVVFRFGI